jgi:hypothetical protein
MIAFAFLLSCFFTSSKTATIFAYLIVFGTGLIGSLLLSRLMSSDLWYMNLVELVPSFALFRWAQAPQRGGPRLGGRLLGRGIDSLLSWVPGRCATKDRLPDASAQHKL